MTAGVEAGLGDVGPPVGFNVLSSILERVRRNMNLNHGE
jgi:hypothetical protein